MLYTLNRHKIRQLKESAFMSAVKRITTLQYLALIHEVSYTTLCKELGITPQQFSDWVKKRRPIPKERLEKLVHYFEIPESELVEESYYLHDLTEQKKIDIQITFLRNRLGQPCTIDEQEAFQAKLEQLCLEKENIAQLERFKTVYTEGNNHTRKLCRAFLTSLEQGHISQLEPILVYDES